MALQRVFVSRIIHFLHNSKFVKSNLKFNLRKLSTEPEDEDAELDEQFFHLTNEIQNHLLPQSGHKVLILQPSRTHGKLQLKAGTEEQSLLEARALVNTLKTWELIDEEYANTRSISAKTFFSKGNYEMLTEKFRLRNDFTAIFLNYNYLSSLQIMTMESDWGKIIYDRYMMVLQIFKLHAQTAEAKLQVQLAELPYFRSRLYGFHKKYFSNVILNQMEKSLNGFSILNSTIEDKYNILKLREHRLRTKIKKLESKRDASRLSRKNSNFPIISVLGYTNAGKTSLIRYLTKDEKIIPEDCYFATLDVTFHDFYMKINSTDFGMKTLLIDTIGFMSDIPTGLIGAFRSTLKDTIETDLLIHVVDLSNNYWKMQMDFTLKTLESFNLPEKLMKSIITVGAKIDCLSRPDLDRIKELIPNLIPISNATGENMNLLHSTVSEALHNNINFIVKRLKISQGSSIYQWIKSNAVIQNEDVTSDGQKLLLDVIFLPNMWAKFQHAFYERK